MIRLLLACLLVCCMDNIRAQNLLANGGFEIRNKCVEFSAICAPEGWFRIPLDPVSLGKGTAGFLAGNHHENIVMENVARPGIFRSYLYTRILCPLEKGREYVFKGSFREMNNQPFVRIELAWLDFEPYHFQSKISRATQRNTITPANYANAGLQGWKEYSLNFTATGEEKYLLIGNFGMDVFPGKATRSLIVYQMDDVSLFPAEESMRACIERDNNEKKLFKNDYRHTPGKFIDEDDEQPAKDTPAVKKDTVLTPVVAEPAPVKEPPVINDTLVIPDVLFRFDRSELNPVFSAKLDSLVDKIRNRAFKRIEVLGHTDSLGNNSYNQRLSTSRAETVKKYLTDRLHYSSDNIVIKSFAATLPVSSNSTAAGRQKNRRVEIVLIR